MGSVFIPQPRLCPCWLSQSVLFLRKLCSLGWATDPTLDVEEEQGRVLDCCWGTVRSVGAELIRLRLNPGGRVGPPGPGQDRTAGSCQAHNLILRLYCLCLGDFQLAVVSFTDGFAAANYKFVSNSFSNALKKKAYPSANHKFITNSVIQLNAKQMHYQLHYSIEYQMNELHGVLCGSGTCQEMGTKQPSPHFPLLCILADSAQANPEHGQSWIKRKLGVMVVGVKVMVMVVEGMTMVVSQVYQRRCPLFCRVYVSVV